MRTWLKRMVAGIVSAGTLMGGGLLMAGTANADEIRMPDIGKTITSLTASAATTYPRELVNGGFDYLPAGGWNVISPKLNTSRGKFTSVDPVNGQYIRNAYVTDGNVAWVKWDGFDASKFGWISDQKGGKPQGFVTDHANSVELQRDNDTDNTYAEIVGSEIGKSIYQKIDTQSSTDAVYTVRFDHAALSSEHADGMQALVNGKPVTMTRIGGNKAGDKTGWTGTDIVTHATNTDHYRHDGQWATYEGKVTIPANTPVSTFTFKSLNEAKPDMGNLIDNLTFKIAYRLSYDSNGGTKAKASQISSMTEGKASETDGKVKTVADDAAGRTVLECKRSGEGATGPYADKFCWIDWSNLPLNRTGEPIPVRINVPDGHIDADATVAHTDNAALTAKDYTGNKWSRLIPAYRLTGNTALAFSHIQGNSADPLASVMFSNITPVVNQTATSVNVLKDFQLAFGDAETMSGYVVNDKKIYEQTDIESDKTLDKLGMIGDNNPNQSYSEANTGYGTTHVTLAGGPAGAHALTDEADSKGAAVIGATQPTRFKVSFKQVNHPADDSWSAIAIGVYMPYLTAYPLTYDKNGRDATGSVPSNETAGTVRQTKSKTNGSVRLAADDDVAEYAANGLPDHLVNGDFEYPVKSDMPANDGKFWYISQNDGSYFANGTVKRYKLPEGFDKAKFAWHSTQTGDTSYPDLERADDVQVDYKADGTNHYSEISAAQSGATIYQDVATVPGAMYKWSLKHASLDSSHLDKMSVIIGEPGKETAQEATRTTANGHGDKLGKVGTVISTKVSNPENKFQEGAHTGQWETYTGTYIATGTVTRFAFHSVEGYNAWNGNLLDDISFSKAYKLTYDKNASDATGSVPSDTTANTVNQAKADATGTVKTVTDTKTKTSGTVKTVADTNASLPDHLVNGDFSVNYKDQWLTGGWNWTSITPDGKYLNSVRNWNDSATIWKTVNGWDKTKFGWSSTQKDGTDNIQHKAGATEIQYDDQADNVYAELCAYEKGTAIYQDIKTVPGVLYKIRLKHASLYSGYLDKMQVLIGAPGHETPVEMTRTSVNGHGDKLNEKSTVIATKVTNGNNRHHESQWETYEGTYLIPDGQATTRFTFKSIDAKQLDRGNVLDDIVFDKAYRLSYDKNATDANGSVPSSQYGKENTVQPAKSKTTGSVGLAADKTASGLTVHDLKKNDKGKVPSNSKADSTQPAAFKAPDAKAETIASRAAGDELAVNGGFDTPKWTIAKEGQGLPWVYVKPNAGTIRSYAQAMAGQTGVKAGGLTAATFAWQDLDAIGSNQNFELHREKDGNTAADVHAGRTVAQTVNTTPGASYTFSIRHSGRSKGNAGGVTLLTGPDKDHLTPVKLTRTTVSKTGQKYGDKTGDVGTVAYTHSDSMDATEGSHEPWDHSDDWESYEGTVIIPAGQSRTMIAYRGVAKDGTLTASANDSIIDDLSFRLAYKLSYDANGGAKKSTSQIKASTDGKVKTIAGKTDSLPTELVNGSFDYPAGLIAGVSTKYPWDDWTVVDPINGRYARHIGIDKDPWAPIPGWDASKFAWKSTQTKGTDWQQIAQGVELQKDSKTGNQYAELVAGQAGTAIYQDIATIPGVSYRWTLKHASLDRNHLDGMSVMIGEPGKESAQDARRTTVNGNGDQPGDVGKVISTKVSNDAESNHESNHSSRNHDGQWETYTGTYIATGTVTRFTFKSVSSSNNVNGNILDDLSFTKAYRLGYDANGGKGQVPSRTEVGKTETAASKTNGTVRPAADKNTGPESGATADDRRVLTDTTIEQDDGTAQRTITRSDGSVRVETIADTGAVSGCQVYYPAGTRITLATAKADSDCWDSSQIGKTNRTFYGWSANTDANDRDVPVGDTMDRNTLNANVRTEIVMPARAKTVYALWAINPTLSYNVNTPAGSNAPGTPASQTVPYNTAAADKSGWAADDTGKIPGYRFDGWYTAPNGGNKYDFNTPLTNNVTVYAHWIGNGYTVRFTGNGATGGNTPDQAFQYNIGQNLHRNGFVRDGYTFTGWKRADNQQAYGDGQWVTNLTTQPNGIVTMVAQWSANEAHIRYNPNPPAGKTTGGQGTPNWDGHTGDTPTIGQNGWTIDGYTFAGWATSPDGSGARYAPGARWTANGTLTLYAQWTPGQASLTYDGNGATGGKTDPQTGKTDEKINVRDNGFTRDGYTFVTWNTQADCKGNAVKPNSEWTLRGSSTLYACWAGNAQTLTYHGNGATGGNTAAQSGKTGDELTTNANGFTRDGYTFVRWDTAKDGSGTAYGEGKNGVSQYVMKPAGNDLYAIWKANPATIQYRNDWPNTTGSTPDTTGNTGDTVTISQNSFDRPGYTFTGWSTSKRGDPSLQPGDKHTLEPRTTTVWAQWKADPAHLVYNSNIGTVGSETKTVDGVVDQTVKTITNPFDRPGYTFSGWNTQADGKGKAYATGADYVLTANDKSTPKNTSVLYAQWKINGASLKFNPNGGIGHVDDVTGDAFSTVTIPGDAKEPKITRPGYRFVGWSTEKNPPAGSTFLQPGEGKVTLPAEGSTTVYAQWEPSLTTLPFTGGQAQVPTIWLYAGFALMLIALGVMMPMLRMRMAATKRTGKHMPITGGKHAK
ncbi:InlB B-repeat-containing protein [Bifidobacterium longum]|uniref:InlB B-repeat-containing protein n=1 Tax=Bifidobacterium longum TaxID=216816 RepID=UPI0034541834